MLAKLKGWKTIIVNAAMGAANFGLILMPYLLGVDWLKLGISGGAAAWVVFGVNIANISLRFVTTTPVGARY